MRESDYILVEATRGRRFAAALIDNAIAAVAAVAVLALTGCLLPGHGHHPRTPAWVFLVIYSVVNIWLSLDEPTRRASFGHRRMRIEIRQADGALPGDAQLWQRWRARHWPSFLVPAYLLAVALGFWLGPDERAARHDFVVSQQRIAGLALVAIILAGAWVGLRGLRGVVDRRTGTELFARRPALTSGAFEPVIRGQAGSPDAR